MVATTDCAKTKISGPLTKIVTGKKVSKPLMEKKRRARINKCLDQLKSLLEDHYTNNIRKRKLEKADILELTVKHLKYLQKIQGSSMNSEVSDYQAGFRSCLAGVNQYLLMADSPKGSSRLCMLTHLSSNLLCTGGQTLKSSTLDSDSGKHRAEEAKLQRHLSAVEASKAQSTVPLARCVRSFNPHISTGHVSHSRPTEVTGERPSSGASQVFATAHKQTAQEKNSLSALHKNKDHSIVQCRNDVAGSLSQDIWRPW